MYRFLIFAPLLTFLILVKNDIIASEQKQFQTDWEILWVKIELVGTRPLHIAAYYRPKENDACCADEFTKSYEKVSKEKGDIWVLGDLNYPKLDWDKNDVPYIKQDMSTPGYMIVSLRYASLITKITFISFRRENKQVKTSIHGLMCGVLA